MTAKEGNGIKGWMSVSECRILYIGKERKRESFPMFQTIVEGVDPPSEKRIKPGSVPPDSNNVYKVGV